MNRLFNNSKWMLWLFAVLFIACALTGCKSFSVFNPTTWFSPNAKPECNNADDTGSFAALLQFAKWAYAPGVAILALSVLAGIASNWFPPLKALSDLWRLGMALLILGLGVAALPWALQNFGQPAIWITLGFAVVVGGLWVWGRRKKIMQGDLM